MAKISINTNLGEITDRIAERLAKLTDKNYLLRPVCFDLIELMKLRIHEKGLNASDSAIGKYSKWYMPTRKKNNRGTDRNVIISLTRQLENDWSVIATQKGYGIGFKNPFNLQKADWVQNGHIAASVKAHKRTIKTKEGQKSVDVKGHMRKAWAGYGPIFSLTSGEEKYASDLISQLVKKALSND